MEYLPWNTSNDHEDPIIQIVPISPNSHKIHDEMEHPVLSLLENPKKLRQKHDQNFQMEGKPF